MLTIEYVAEAVSVVIAQGGLSVCGSLIRYLWEYSKGSKFRFFMFFMHGLAGILLGNMVHGLIDDGSTYKVSVLWLVGFMAYPLLDIINTRGVEWLTRIGVLK